MCAYAVGGSHGVCVCYWLVVYLLLNYLSLFELLRAQTLGSVLPSIACGNVVDMLLE